MSVITVFLVLGSVGLYLIRPVGPMVRSQFDPQISFPQTRKVASTTFKSSRRHRGIGAHREISFKEVKAHSASSAPSTR